MFPVYGDVSTFLSDGRRIGPIPILRPENNHILFYFHSFADVKDVSHISARSYDEDN